MNHDDIKANCVRLLAKKLTKAERADVKRLVETRSYTKREKVTVSELVRRYLP